MEQKKSVMVHVRPCHPENMMILDVLTEEQCNSEIRSLFTNRIQEYAKKYKDHELFQNGYPAASAQFRLISIGQKEKSDRFAPFAALWLPSILFNIETIKLKLPLEMQGVPIVGYDTNFSFFGESAQLLYINPTQKEAELALKQCAPHEVPKDWLCLVEL